MYEIKLFNKRNRKLVSTIYSSEPLSDFSTVKGKAYGIDNVVMTIDGITDVFEDGGKLLQCAFVSVDRDSLAVGINTFNNFIGFVRDRGMPYIKHIFNDGCGGCYANQFTEKNYHIVSLLAGNDGYFEWHTLFMAKSYANGAQSKSVIERMITENDGKEYMVVDDLNEIVCFVAKDELEEYILSHDVMRTMYEHRIWECDMETNDSLFGNI